MSPSFAPPCVAALYERGPWRTRETFGGDELANVNRYNLWPDPLLNPRTTRESDVDGGQDEPFCPVPQMVGGGTVHWQGWLPRFTPTTSAYAPWSVTCRAPPWPTGRSRYDDLEPYYDKVEWAFGVSGRAGANAFEGWRSRGYPCPPMPQSRYAERFHQGCSKLGWNSFPTPQAALSRPFGRPTGHRRQRIRAAARRPDRHPVQRAERLRPRRRGHRPLRPATGQLRP